MQILHFRYLPRNCLLSTITYLDVECQVEHGIIGVRLVLAAQTLDLTAQVTGEYLMQRRGVLAEHVQPRNIK